jgi:nucleoside-diphosphate-sugar epimerase
MAMESPKAENNDFNISTDENTKIIDLAQRIWVKINGNKPFNVVHDEPFQYDIQHRQPNTNKAREVLGFNAEYTLDSSLDEVIDYIKKTMLKNENTAT